jgi:hypothetical protein
MLPISQAHRTAVTTITTKTTMRMKHTATRRKKTKITKEEETFLIECKLRCELFLLLNLR